MGEGEKLLFLTALFYASDSIIWAYLSQGVSGVSERLITDRF